MVCNACGKDNPVNRKTCWNCGEALAAGFSRPPSPARLNSGPSKAVTIYGYLFIVAAAILLIVAILEMNSGGTHSPIVALTAFFQAALFGVTGWSILAGHRWAVKLVWVTTVLGAIGVLFRGLVPLDLLLWLASLGLAIWYTRKRRSSVRPHEVNAELVDSVSNQPSADPALSTDVTSLPPLEVAAHGASPVAHGTIAENPEAGQVSEPALTTVHNVPSPVSGSGAAPGKRTATWLWISIVFGAAAVIAAGVLVFTPELRTMYQMHARRELAELNYQYDTASFTKAASKGDTLAVRLFLESGMSLNGAAKTKGTLTPLMVAAYYGHAETVRFLLDKGADVNFEDSGGDTAFSAAAMSQEDNVATMKLLLKRGANLHIPLKKDSQFVSLCDGPLIAAVSGLGAGLRSNINNLNYLLEMGADVNSSAVDITGRFEETPLSCAVLANNPAAVKLLLEHGAQVRAGDLFYAWNADVWKLLRDAAQKDPTFWDRYKDYPPHVLASLRDAMKSYQDTQIVRFLSHYRSGRQGRNN